MSDYFYDVERVFIYCWFYFESFRKSLEKLRIYPSYVVTNLGRVQVNSRYSGRTIRIQVYSYSYYVCGPLLICTADKAEYPLGVCRTGVETGSRHCGKKSGNIYVC